MSYIHALKYVTADEYILSTNTVLHVGLDAAGKTTTLYKMKLGEVVTTIPTIGENSTLKFVLCCIHGGVTDVCLFQSALDVSLQELYLIQALSLITHHAGFLVETVSYKNVDFVNLDIGGRDKMVSIGRLAFIFYRLLCCRVQCRDNNIQGN